MAEAFCPERFSTAIQERFPSLRRPERTLPLRLLPSPPAAGVRESTSLPTSSLDTGRQKPQLSYGLPAALLSMRLPLPRGCVHVRRARDFESRTFPTYPYTRQSSPGKSTRSLREFWDWLEVVGLHRNPYTDTTRTGAEASGGKREAVERRYGLRVLTSPYPLPGQSAPLALGGFVMQARHTSLTSLH